MGTLTVLSLLINIVCGIILIAVGDLLKNHIEGLKNIFTNSLVSKEDLEKTDKAKLVIEFIGTLLSILGWLIIISSSISSFMLLDKLSN